MNPITNTTISPLLQSAAQSKLALNFEVGIRLLLQAFEYAGELEQDAWDFAVELSCLRHAGLTHNDLRWLVLKGYVEHGREITKSNDARRVFSHDKNLMFDERTCFALTESGLSAAREMDSARDVGKPGCNPEHDRITRVAGAWYTDVISPIWDRDRQELWLGSLLVKQFKLPSPNQEAVLMAFEEESWPPRVDDPLSPAPEIDPKRRLSDTIKSLNRKQKNRAIRFMGDGSGAGIRWESVSRIAG